MTLQTSLGHVWAVVPAGGAGTRLWPLSRRHSPKFLHDLTGSGRTLIQATIDRLSPLVADRVLVVTGRAHRDAVAGQLPALPEDHIIAEPSARDSMAAIGLAAALLERRDPDAVMGSFAADHIIADETAFADVVRRAAAAAADDWLVTIGIEPTHPATGFGYIDPSAEELPGLPGVRQVRHFVEKPDQAMAEDYVRRGFRWNAGMFVVRPRVLLDLLAAQDPEFAARLRAIAADPSDIDSTWEDLPRIALDHAVAEPAAAAGRVAVVPGSFSWDDVGDFASLRELLGSAEAECTVLGEPGLVRAVDSSGLVVPAAGRTVAVVGMRDVVVVDTGDAVLVTNQARAQDVKQIVAGLNRDGLQSLT